jgi:hypothetical protein
MITGLSNETYYSVKRDMLTGLIIMCIIIT